MTILTEYLLMNGAGAVGGGRPTGPTHDEGAPEGPQDTGEGQSTQGTEEGGQGTQGTQGAEGAPEGPPPNFDGEAFAEFTDGMLGEPPPETGTPEEQQQNAQRLQVLKACAARAEIVDSSESGFQKTADSFNEGSRATHENQDTFQRSTDARSFVRAGDQQTHASNMRQMAMNSLAKLLGGGKLTDGSMAGKQTQQGQNPNQPNLAQDRPGPRPGDPTQGQMVPQGQQQTTATTARPSREASPSTLTPQQRQNLAHSLRQKAAGETNPEEKARLEGLAQQLEGDQPVDEATLAAAMAEVGEVEGEEGTEGTEETGRETGEGGDKDSADRTRRGERIGGARGGEEQGTGGGEGGDQQTADLTPPPSVPEITLSEGLDRACTDFTTEGESGAGRTSRMGHMGERAIIAGRTYCITGDSRYVVGGVRERQSQGGWGEDQGFSQMERGNISEADLEGVRPGQFHGFGGQGGIHLTRGGSRYAMSDYQALYGEGRSQLDDRAVATISQRVNLRLMCQTRDRFMSDAQVQQAMSTSGYVPADLFA